MTDTVWMSPTGDDANPGTHDLPVATFRAAYALLPGGGTVRLHVGVYGVHAYQDSPPSGVRLVGSGRGSRRSPWWRRILRRPRPATALVADPVWAFYLQHRRWPEEGEV